MLVFTDRAQGVTVYDNSLLVNIDRLTYDDYKGVGEGYMHMINQTYKMKVAMLDSKDSDNHVERLWQRQYDEANVGYISGEKRTNDFKSSGKNSLDKLKYTIFVLNKN